MIALPRIIVKRWRDAGVDVLVNNAGMGRNDASLFDGNTASWVEMVSTNTLGVCMCTREAVQVKMRHLTVFLLREGASACAQSCNLVKCCKLVCIAYGADKLTCLFELQSKVTSAMCVCSMHMQSAAIELQ